MPLQTLAIFFLAVVAMGGVAWVFVYPVLSGERKAEKRVANVARTDPTARISRGRPKHAATSSKTR
jgi:tight adherence protein B